MATSVENYETDENQPGPFAALTQTIKRTAAWLGRLFTLSDEERTQAGIYHGGEGREG